MGDSELTHWFSFLESCAKPLSLVEQPSLSVCLCLIVFGVKRGDTFYLEFGLFVCSHLLKRDLGQVHPWWSAGHGL